MPAAAGSGPVGLSLMAKAVLGKPINKAMQCSSWGRRPLTAAQLRYAALDAHATLLVYERVMACMPGTAPGVVQTLLKQG